MKGGDHMLTDLIEVLGHAIVEVVVVVIRNK